MGCYDMSGNVLEWCHDKYSSTYYSEGAMTNPTGPSSGIGVVRGGIWGIHARYCRTAHRDDNFREYAKSDFGFRLSRSR
jgi:formylglycine-generating enzyme required for sulfatase activity